jgi:hypothetical protein
MALTSLYLQTFSKRILTGETLHLQDQLAVQTPEICREAIPIVDVVRGLSTPHMSL